MRRRQDNKLARNLVTLFIVILMVGSVVGYMFGRNSEDSFKYGDYKFLRKGNKFVLEIDKIKFEFHYFPSDVENIDIDSEIFDKCSNKLEIDSTYDYDSKWKEGISVAQYDLERYFAISDIYFVKGLTTENEFEMSVITCEDATSKTPVLYFKESNETKIFAEGDCIISEARNELDFLKIKDRLIYGLLGIIKDE